MEFTTNSTIAHIKEMASILDEVYMGFTDDHYAYFRRQAGSVLAMDKAVGEQSEADQKDKEVQSEMKQILDALQQKVEELISAGMLDEAEKSDERNTKVFIAGIKVDKRRRHGLPCAVFLADIVNYSSS